MKILLILLITLSTGCSMFKDKPVEPSIVKALVAGGCMIERFKKIDTIKLIDVKCYNTYGVDNDVIQ